MAVSWSAVRFPGQTFASLGSHPQLPLIRILLLPAGNWKCNGTQDSVSQLVRELNAGKCTHVQTQTVAPSLFDPLG
jgi:hypothetical protein